jgi:hypothetical protein
MVRFHKWGWDKPELVKEKKDGNKIENEGETVHTVARTLRSSEHD